MLIATFIILVILVIVFIVLVKKEDSIVETPAQPPVSNPPIPNPPTDPVNNPLAQAEAKNKRIPEGGPIK
jgi:hypothetical protein